MDLWALLSDIVVLLAASLVLGGLFTRIGQSPIVGYLVAGMILGGPGSIGVVKSEREIEAIAELGVALLLFSLGLEFSIARLRQLGLRPLLGGIAQVVLTVLIGAAAAAMFGLAAKPALAFGAMIALSSTAVVLRTLMERAELEMPHGRNSLAVLLTQDMAVVPLALLVTLLAGNSDLSTMFGRVGQLLLMSIVLVVSLYILNKIAVHTLGVLTVYRNRELTVIFAVVTGLGSAWAAHAVGISPALGAFVAGMLLGSSEFATQIRADVSSLRVVLLTLFFGAAGMVADPVWIVRNWYLVAGVTALLAIGKMVIVVAIFRLLGQSLRVAAATGLCLAQIGEFAFVLGSIGRANGAVSDDTYALVVSASIISFILTAIFVPQAPRFGAWVAARAGKSPTTDDSPSDSGHAVDVVIIGFGPAGQIAARPLIDAGKRVLVIDLNREGVALARQQGFAGQIGDATQAEVLEHAHVQSAATIVIAIPHHDSAITILQRVRGLAPSAHVVVRSRHQMHTKSFEAAGAHAVVGDEESVGEGIAGHLREWLAEDAAAREVWIPEP